MKKYRKKIFFLRERVLKYSNSDINLELENDKQVYLAVFDIPIESNLVGFHTQILVLLFGLNTLICHGGGKVIVGLEKNINVMKAMQSLFFSCQDGTDHGRRQDRIYYGRGSGIQPGSGKDFL